MAENFINQPFGKNIKIPSKTLKQIEKTAQEHAGGILEPLFNFIDDNQKVFTGNIANEIEKYNLMSYNVGAALRRDSTNMGFDVKG